MLVGLAAVAAANSTSVSPTPHWTLQPETELYGVTAGDFDGDGTDDVVHTVWDAVALFHGGPAGPPVIPDVILPTGTWPVARVVDVSGDGLDDLIVGDQYAGSGGALKVYLGSATGLPAQPSWEYAGTGQLGLRVDPIGDLDGDGYEDLMVAEGLASLYTYRWWRGGAAGLQPTDWTVTAWHLRVAAGDLDGDGWLDVVVASTQGAVVDLYRGSAAGPGATPVWTLAVPFLYGMLLVDTTGAGASDLVLHHGLTDPVIAVHPPDGGVPAAQPAQVLRLADRGSVTRGRDLDGDGTDELVFALGTDVWTLPAGALPTEPAAWPAPIVASSTLHPDIVASIAEMAAGDFDGDGLVDLLLGGTYAWASGGFTSYGSPNTDPDVVLALWYGSGAAPTTGGSDTAVDTGTGGGTTPPVDTAADTTPSTEPDDDPGAGDPPEGGCGCGGRAGGGPGLLLLVALTLAGRAGLGQRRATGRGTRCRGPRPTSAGSR